MKLLWGPVTLGAILSLLRLLGGACNDEPHANKFLSRSLFLFHLGGSACNNCDIEILDCADTKIRFGAIRHHRGWKHSACGHHSACPGSSTRSQPSVCNAMYEQAPKPVIVVAIGGCACTGLIFQDSYNWDVPVGDYIPIDAYVAGCPPKPEAIIAAITQVIDKLRNPAKAGANS